MVRRAEPEEAQALWRIRNLAIRAGCEEAYGAAAVRAWTPDEMSGGYIRAISQNPFFVADEPGFPVATGFLDLREQSVEAIFTLPDYMGNGYATQILAAIKSEALARGILTLTLSSTPNAVTFYQRHGFAVVKETLYHSALAGNLLCMEMHSRLTE
ncbi:GNAT family N-acetyltransferase [Kalamiella sp. sgz302252]|uniref:GNAT family N-acetyltransferase n=1 Tax=Pantoea sp. sgz302252 TaxID=3341827 RepID=UPI0036D21031